MYKPLQLASLCKAFEPSCRHLAVQHVQTVDLLTDKLFNTPHLALGIAAIAMQARAVATQTTTSTSSPTPMFSPGTTAISHTVGTMPRPRGSGTRPNQVWARDYR